MSADERSPRLERMSSSAKTRIVRLDGAPPRDEATNSMTRVLRYERRPTPGSFRELFVRNYEAIRHACTHHARAGVAVLAVASAVRSGKSGYALNSM